MGDQEEEAGGAMRMEQFEADLPDAIIACSAVYADDPAFELQRVGHRFTHMSASKDGQCKMLIALRGDPVARTGTAQVSFCGSVNEADWRTNLSFWPTVSSNGTFHSGIYWRADCVPVAMLLDLVRQGYRLVFSGHSLGGATAIIVGYHVYCQLLLLGLPADSVSCITFGAPLVAIGEMATTLNLGYGQRCLNIIHARDIVPRALSLAQDLAASLVTNITQLLEAAVDPAKTKENTQLAKDACSTLAQACFSDAATGLTTAALDVAGAGLRVAADSLIKATSSLLRQFKPALLSLIAYRPVGHFCVLGVDPAHPEATTWCYGLDASEHVRSPETSTITVDCITTHYLKNYMTHVVHAFPRANLSASERRGVSLPGIPTVAARVSSVSCETLPSSRQVRLRLHGACLTSISTVAIEGLFIKRTGEPIPISTTCATSTEILLTLSLRDDAQLDNVGRRQLTIRFSTIFNAQPREFTRVPLTVAPSTMSPIDEEDIKDLLGRAVAASLLSSPSTDSILPFKIVKLSLAVMFDSLPIELAYLPLIQDLPISPWLISRLTKVRPLSVSLLSDVGLEILTLSVRSLRTKVGEGQINEDVRNRLDATLAATEFTQASTVNALDLLGIAAITMGPAAVMAAGALLPGSALLGFGALALGAGVWRSLQEHNASDVERLLITLEDALARMRNDWKIIGCPRYCGVPISVVVQVNNGTTDEPHMCCEPLASLDMLITHHRNKLTEAETRYTRRARGQEGPVDLPELVRETLAALGKSFLEADSFAQWMLYFYEPSARPPESPLSPLSMDTVYTPRTGFWQIFAAGVKATGRTVFKGTVGVVAAAARSARDWEASPLIRQFKDIHDLWTKDVAQQGSQVTTYEGFVKWFLALLRSKQSGARVDVAALPDSLVECEERLVGLIRSRPVHIEVTTPLNGPNGVVMSWPAMFPELRDCKPGFIIDLAVRVKAVLLLHDLRVNIRALPLVGVFGVSNAGKTTLVRHLMTALGPEGARMVPKPGQKHMDRTIIPRIYVHPRCADVAFLDAGGYDDVHFQVFMDWLRDMTAISVLLCRADQHANTAGAQLLEVTVDTRQDHVRRRPTLTCVTWADQFYDCEHDDPDMAMLDSLDEEEIAKGLHMRAMADDDDDATPRVWCVFEERGSRFHGSIPVRLKGRIHSQADVATWVFKQVRRFRPTPPDGTGA